MDWIYFGAIQILDSGMLRVTRVRRRTFPTPISGFRNPIHVSRIQMSELNSDSGVAYPLVRNIPES